MRSRWDWTGSVIRPVRTLISGSNAGSNGEDFY